MEGRAEGEKQKAVAIARAMKKHGDDIDYIVMVTGLSKEEINFNFFLFYKNVISKFKRAECCIKMCSHEI